RSLELVQEQRWMAFLPWPQALEGELELRARHLAAAGRRFQHAYALACQLGAPCWEGMAARGLGLLRATVGDHAKATAWLEEAHVRCTRVSDRYQWVRGHVLDALVATAIAPHDHARPHAGPGRRADGLPALAARGAMRELVVRAHLHRSHLGDPTALASARL